MDRINKVFEDLTNNNKKALIPFITAGDPDSKTSLELMHAMVKNGADVLEIGMPFSDPMADGPVIQAANERSLKNNTTIQTVFDLIKNFRATNQTTPIILMGYLNPIEYIGYERFAMLANEAGVDGLILVDLPIEESEKIQDLFAQKNLSLIYLITPTSTPQRIDSIISLSSSYIYYVSVKGITGNNKLDLENIKIKLKQLKQKTDLPICIGFGIKDADMASNMAAISDGVIIGSTIVNKIAEKGKDSVGDVAEFIAQCRSVL